MLLASTPSARTFVCGVTGSGKTTWIRRELETIPRLLVYDHMAEFPALTACTYVHTVTDALAFLKRHKTGFARCALVPAANAATLFPLVCRIPFAVPGLTVVFDELDTFAGAVRPPTPLEFQRLTHFGRHFGCSVIGASRRPADVSRAFTSQCRRIVCFRVTEPADLKFLRATVGDAALRLPDLPDLAYLRFEGHELVEEGTVDPADAGGSPTSSPPRELEIAAPDAT